MKKVILLDFISLRKAYLIVLFTIMILSFSSCASLIDMLLGESGCAHPGCNRNATQNTAYCHFHIPPTINENDHITIDSKNAYKVHKPPAHTDVKIKRKN